MYLQKVRRVKTNAIGSRSHSGSFAMRRRASDKIWEMVHSDSEGHACEAAKPRSRPQTSRVKPSCQTFAKEWHTILTLSRAYSLTPRSPTEFTLVSMSRAGIKVEVAFCGKEK